MSRSDDLTVSAIVVSYETRELTLACVRSFLHECEGLEHELIVIDNASRDGSPAAIAAEFTSVRLIALEENIGFGAACNLGAREARGRLLLMLNPDTVVLDDAVRRLVAFADRRPEARLWGGRTVFADGTLNPTSCWARPTVWSAFAAALGLASRFPDLCWCNPEGYGGWRRDDEREVAIVSGCWLLIERALWRELGGFSRDFFMYGEDADLCLRARALGARPVIDPESVIVHHGGASETVREDQLVRLFTGKAQLFRKFEAPLRARSMLACLDLWALWRTTALAFVANFSPRRHAAARAWRSVWKRRRAWHDAFERTRPYAAAGSPRHGDGTSEVPVRRAS